MTLSPGTSLGTYEVVALLGSGGMGEVYRAKDTKLGRDVALKILPDSFTHDAERVARFRREAQVLASLNHPHIGAIYGLDDANSTQFLVLELVDGDSLDRRLARGPIPAYDALAIAKQIAEALEAAHEKGIIHRDLKPANIALTREGSVKVLDFGLAKATEAARETSLEVTNSPTITTPAMMTSVGAILGTAAYMSPEQTRGRAVDKRTDIWAFGCVLYELLTGRLAYRGETVSDLVAAILEREPDWRALPNATPQNVRRLLRRCLEKDPKQRLHDVADARLELEEVLTAPPPPVSGSEIVAPVRPERWTIRRVARSALVAAGGLGVGAGLATALLVATGRWGGSEESIETRFQVLPPPGASFEGPLAVSPDGHWLAFVALSGGEARLWVRPRNSVIAQSLEGTAGARSPFWSPDSRSIAFFAAGRLKRIVLSGGLPQSIADAANPTGGTWSRDDVILFVPYNEVALYRIAAGGGELIRVPSVDRSGQVLVPNHPYFLSDGRHFLYYGRSPRPERSGIYLGSLDSGESDLLLGGIAETKVAYSPPGYLLFMREEALVAQPFDERHLTLAGKPLQAAERIAYDEANYASFAASATGVLAYWGASRRNGQIVLFDRSGNRLGHIGQTGEYSAPSLSPDQSQLAVEHLGEDRHTIWLIDWQRQLPSRFATYAWGVHHPVWSPDGRWIAYVGGREGLQLHRKAVNADTPDEQLTFSTAVARPNDWTGNVLVYEQVDPGTGWDIWYLPFVTPRKPVPFLQTPFNEVQGHLSPDGKWLAYTSDESGTLEAYVQSFPLAGDKRRVSIRGGAQPKWRSDGKELFYLSGDRHLMVAQVRSRSPFVLGDPQPLFATGIRGTIAIAAASNNNYAVTSDGQRFYVNTSVEQSNIAPITVVLNWTRSLRQ